MERFGLHSLSDSPVEKLTITREQTLPMHRHASLAIVEFFTSPPRSWTHEPGASTPFHLEFYRGNWRQRRFLRPLAGTFLAKVLAVRSPRPPSVQERKIQYSTRPTELAVRIAPERGRLQVTFTYRFYFAGRRVEIDREERRHWKQEVEREALELLGALSGSAIAEGQ
jgi:hypothetical protein